MKHTILKIFPIMCILQSLSLSKGQGEIIHNASMIYKIEFGVPYFCTFGSLEVVTQTTGVIQEECYDRFPNTVLEREDGTKTYPWLKYGTPGGYVLKCPSNLTNNAQLHPSCNRLIHATCSYTCSSGYSSTAGVSAVTCEMRGPQTNLTAAWSPATPCYLIGEQTTMDAPLDERSWTITQFASLLVTTALVAIYITFVAIIVLYRCRSSVCRRHIFKKDENKAASKKQTPEDEKQLDVEDNQPIRKTYDEPDEKPALHQEDSQPLITNQGEKTMNQILQKDNPVDKNNVSFTHEDTGVKLSNVNETEEAVSCEEMILTNANSLRDVHNVHQLNRRNTTGIALGCHLEKVSMLSTIDESITRSSHHERCKSLSSNPSPINVSDEGLSDLHIDTYPSHPLNVNSAQTRIIPEMNEPVVSIVF